jgi:hypothetical protein
MHPKRRSFFRNLGLAAAITAAAVTAAPAQNISHANLEIVPGKTTTVGELMTRLRARPADARRADPQIVELDVADNTFLLQGAANLIGAGGLPFTADVTITNYRSSAQWVAIGWLQQGLDNSASSLFYTQLSANTIYNLRDFVTNTLHESGLGSVVVISVFAPNTTTADSNGFIDGVARISTPVPNTGGGFASLSFPAVALVDSVGTSGAYVTGLRQDADYRTNVGIINLDSVSHTFRVQVIGTSSELSVSIPPFSMNQLAIPSGTFGDVALRISTTASGAVWSAYGVSVNNKTGDGWVNHAAQ